MGIADLFRPKHRHSNVRVRTEAVKAMTPDDAELIKVARTDSDIGVRRLAIEKIAEAPVLAELAAAETERSLRDFAGERAAALWKSKACGPDEEAANNALSGLLKLGGLVGDPEPEADVQVAALPADPNLGVLFEAVSRRTPVELRYRDKDRRIDPWRLEFQRGRWYLTGWDHTHGEERNFRLDRIDGAVALVEAEPFEVPASADLPGRARGAWELGGEAEVRARIRIDAAEDVEARTCQERRRVLGGRHVADQQGEPPGGNP